MTRARLLVGVVLLCASTAWAGTGKVRQDLATGVMLLDFCVSIRFDATPAELDRIEDVFQGASDTLFDTTDGAYAFGLVRLINNDVGGGWEAEAWIHPGCGRANAPLDHYGSTVGAHTNLYYGSNFQYDRAEENDYYTVAHEFIHLVWGVGDEYTSDFLGGVVGAAECDESGSPGVTFSIMDSFLSTGANWLCQGVCFTNEKECPPPPCTDTRCDNFTVNELCIEPHHDPDGDTNQQDVNGESCWATLESHLLRPVELATTLPVDAPPANPPVVLFVRSTPQTLTRAFALCLDRSGSMSAEDLLPDVPGTRLDHAIWGAQNFLGGLSDADWATTISFADTAIVEEPMAPVATARPQLIDSISDLQTGGQTSIGAAILTGIAEISERAPDSCARAVLVLTDGKNTVDPAPDDGFVLDALLQSDIGLFVIAYGDEPESGLLRFIAETTGGSFYHVQTPQQLFDAISRAMLEYDGNVLLGGAPGMAPAGGGVDASTVFVDPTATEARVQISWADAADDLQLTLRLPNGDVVQRSDAASPGIRVIETPVSMQIVVGAPRFVPGNWLLEVDNATTETSYALLSACNSGNATLSLQTNRPVALPGEPVRVQASPMYQGRGVTPGPGVQVVATVSGPGLGITRGSLLKLLDDGNAARGDAWEGDGVYSGFFTPPEMGIYTIDVQVLVTGSAVTAPGEPLFETAPSASIPSVPFQRTTREQIVVGLDGICHVDITADRGDGTSWANAMNDLQDALDRCRANPHIREIRIAQGTYRPDRLTGDRDLSFEFVNRVNVVGGYPGHDASDPNDRSLATGPTVLSGDLNGDDGVRFSNRSDNSNNVVLAPRLTRHVLIKGLTIRGGNATTPFLTSGGGVLASGRCLARFEEVIFTDNSAAVGGGFTGANGALPTFLRCDFVGNRGTSRAGACSLSTSGDVVIDRCRFIGNTQGALDLTSADPLITNSLFVGNTTTGFGGAIDVGIGSETVVTGCTLVSNSASNGSNRTGGAIYAGGGEVFVNNSILWDNTGDTGSLARQQIDGTGTFAANWSIVEGYTTFSIPGSNISGANPLFVDERGPDRTAGTGDEDLRLMFDSPAVDSGNINFEAGVLDYDGNPRVADGDNDGTATPDRGAYELVECAFVDIAGPAGVVNVLDLLEFLGLWFVSDPSADTDGSGAVDVLDLLGFLACWFTSSG